MAPPTPHMPLGMRTNCIKYLCLSANCPIINFWFEIGLITDCYHSESFEQFFAKMSTIDFVTELVRCFRKIFWFRWDRSDVYFWTNTIYVLNIVYIFIFYIYELKLFAIYSIRLIITWIWYKIALFPKESERNIILFLFCSA